MSFGLNELTQPLIQSHVDIQHDVSFEVPHNKDYFIILNSADDKKTQLD